MVEGLGEATAEETSAGARDETTIAELQRSHEVAVQMATETSPGGDLKRNRCENRCRATRCQHDEGTDEVFR